uniref:PH domain-containing protein n=1 Tax=uncultured Altererythrobacter sp. TaxID=500840 RepID=UPI002635487A|nr:PH domain-containing protein [uncultured Altererythrobacter sp.]
MSGEVATHSAEDTQAQRTAPIGLLITAITSLRQGVIPIAIGAYTFRDNLVGMGGVIALLLVVFGVSVGIAYLSWLRRTYTTGTEDIRVESGIISRAARSVPYERIQDVSLEQKLLPRLFGLVEVKFETGAGGADDLKLAYLTEDQGEALRRLIRARREEEAASAAQVAGEAAAPEVEDEEAETIFAMDTQRLTTFGLFEFSLAVFAVLGGLMQYADTFIGIELWDVDLWQGWIESQSGLLSSFGFVAQIAGVIAGMVALIMIGSVTGLVRTFLRDWGFVLEKTARGFRRRRGLFTKTDVVMPTHRVQALVLGTGWLRYRFGWHGLKFVSLAQDAGSSSHVVAPFAQLEEIEPIIRAAKFEPPSEDLDWRHASRKYRFDSAAIEGGIFAFIAVILATLIGTGIIGEGFVYAAFLPLIPLSLSIFFTGANLYAWQFHRHALSGSQIFGRKGLISPATRVASRVKLHSVEIVQGPIAQRRGYATLHLGLAGGAFSIPGLPIKRARELKSAILHSIASRDFSQLS